VADLPNLQYYRIDYKPAHEANYRFLVRENYKWVKDNEILFTWVTRTVPRGTYDVKLTVVAMDGNYPPPCEIQVTIR
jgi:hypothetical protein